MSGDYSNRKEAFDRLYLRMRATHYAFDCKILENRCKEAKRPGIFASHDARHERHLYYALRGQTVQLLKFTLIDIQMCLTFKFYFDVQVCF